MGWKPVAGETVTEILPDEPEQVYEVVGIAECEYSGEPLIVYKDKTGKLLYSTELEFICTKDPFGCVRDNYIRHEWVHSVLKRARENYGNKDQVAVACEELNELAGVLCKYQRYDTHEAAIQGIKDKVVEEIGDVEIVLNHLYAIFGVDKGAVLDSVMRKVDRLERWLDSGKTLEQSTKDRELKEVGAVNGIEGI